MSSSPYNATGEYQPESTLKLPALFAWPPRPLNALRWVCFDMLFPWGFFLHRARVHILVLPDAFAGKHDRILGRMDSTDLATQRGTVDPGGDWFDQLHHQYFNLNFGNTGAPLDAAFGSWHDGSKESLLVQKGRKRRQRRRTT